MRADARQIEHLVRLADDLLDISRITHGKVELRREVVELSGIVEAAAAAVRSAADEKGHDLAVVLAEGPIWLDADPVRVLQVIENLLSNAVKYTNPGGSIEVPSAVTTASRRCACATMASASIRI